LLRWKLGVVSNAWTDLLPESSLVEQCLRGIPLGFTYVELRQRALGACEISVEGDNRPWPAPARLKGLVEALPRFGFNLAVEAPFWSGTLDADDPYLLQCAEAARAVAPDEAVLRLVDTAAAGGSPDPAEMDRLVEQTSLVSARLAEDENVWKARMHLDAALHLLHETGCRRASHLQSPHRSD